MRLSHLGYAIVIGLLYAGIIWCIGQEPYIPPEEARGYIASCKFLFQPILVGKIYLPVVAVCVMSSFILNLKPVHNWASGRSPWR